MTADLRRILWPANEILIASMDKRGPIDKVPRMKSIILASTLGIQFFASSAWGAIFGLDAILPDPAIENILAKICEAEGAALVLGDLSETLAWENQWKSPRHDLPFESQVPGQSVLSVFLSPVDCDWVINAIQLFPLREFDR